VTSPVRPIAVNVNTGALSYSGTLDPALDSQFQPSDHGFLAWTYDPAAAAAGTIIGNAGTLYAIKIKVPATCLISNIVMEVSTAGATLTAGQNFAALYSGAKALLSATADQTVPWATTGLKTMALSAAQTVSQGYVYACLWTNGSTLPTFTRATALNSPQPNAGLSAANSRWSTADTGLTTTGPATIGTQTAASASYWVAFS
jgi:hypothetical protein